MFLQHQSATHDGTTLDARFTPVAHITSLPDEILLLIFSQDIWKDKLERALTMLSLAKTCRRLVMLVEPSRVIYVAYLEGSKYGYYASHSSTLRILLRDPALGGHLKKANCVFKDPTDINLEDNNLEAFTPHDWELARATIHRVCNLDAWNVQCRSRFHPRYLTRIAPSQPMDNAPNIQPDVALRSDDELDLQAIQIPSITRGKLETEWVRLLELNDYNARIALFLTLAFGLKKVKVYRADYDEWERCPDPSTLSQNLVPILLLGAANLQHERELLPEASDVSITSIRQAGATILPRLFEVEIGNDCKDYCEAPMKITTPWLLPPSVKKAHIVNFGNEKIGSRQQILPWTPVPGLTLGLESLSLESCSITAEALGLLVQSCPCLKSLIFEEHGGEGGGAPTSCIHPQDLMPRLLAVAHSLEHLDLEGVLWANGHSYRLRSAKDPETISILGYPNGDQSPDNQIDETAGAFVSELFKDSNVPKTLHMIKASRFNVDTRFGSFRGFTKLRSLVLKVEHLRGDNACNLPTDLVSILPENLERLWVKDYQSINNCSLIAELLRLANMHGEGLFARLKSIALGDPELFEGGGSELRELSRVCKDVGINLASAGDETKWYFYDWRKKKPEEPDRKYGWHPIED